jgi:4'-phosphopantetheinyl transferase
MAEIEIYWLEQNEADVPAADDWLSPREAPRLSEIRFPKRRADWRLGRWTAKLAVSACLGWSRDRSALSAIEIRPAASGAPEVYLTSKPAKVAISISHRQGIAMCAVVAANSELGCDLEMIEPRSDTFIRDYFTEEEQVAIDNIAGEEDRRRAVALVWSAKESALKAMRVGLRFDTRSVSVTQGDRSAAETGWTSLRVCGSDGRIFDGWWQQSGMLLRTVVATPKSRVPIRLDALQSCS